MNQVKCRCLKANATEKFVERKLQPNVEVPEFTVAGRDIIEAHFVDDGFDLIGVVGEESDSPFVFIETGRAADELKDLTGVFSSRGGVSLHELATVIVFGAIPVILMASSTSLRHRVEADDWPSG